jgi:beta-xylosidase
MRDYHVFSMDSPTGDAVDRGVGLDIKGVPWAKRQVWAPDVAERGTSYYLYFPAKDMQDVFRIGVAVADNPVGPFVAQPEPIKGAYSIDPAVFEEDGKHYLIIGGIRGGQLQRWTNGTYTPQDAYPADDQPALMPRMARLRDDMLSLDEDLRDIVIQDEGGKPLAAGDNARRFFEGAWLHKYNGRYYLSYSTGDTHYIAYATATALYGPYTYRGRVLEPVQGWTTHGSIVEFQGKWYLFYHDTQLSGKTHLRNIKVTELRHNDDGSIETIKPMKQ